MSITFAAVGAGAEVIKKASDLVAVFGKLKAWIMVQPEQAAAELAMVVGEVLKAPQVVNEAVNALLEQIDIGQPKLEKLAAVGNGTLGQDVERRRPHCHEIGRIAYRFLWQWLQQSGVHGANADELRDALQVLSNADDDLFENLTTFAKVIEEVARETFRRASSGHQAEALALLSQVAPALFEAQIKASEFAKMLLMMQIDFQRRALG